MLYEVNLLADTMRTQRLDAQEATALLRAVMAEIDVAIFAFDGHQRLVLVNGFGERLLAQPAPTCSPAGPPTSSVCVTALRADAGIQDISFPGGIGRWEITAAEILAGRPAARDARPRRRQPAAARAGASGVAAADSRHRPRVEQLARADQVDRRQPGRWSRTTPPDDWRDDMQRGLSIIGSRADALGRFTTAYAQLARLPPPNVRPIPWSAFMRRVVALETRMPIDLREGPDVTVNGDSDQLGAAADQHLRNAVDAALETGGGVTAGWTLAPFGTGGLDRGRRSWAAEHRQPLRPVLHHEARGSGIGLALSRQIAEAHGGALHLRNRADTRGARATLTLPLAPQPHLHGGESAF